MRELTGPDAAMSQGVVIVSDNRAASEGQRKQSAELSETQGTAKVPRNQRRVSSPEFGGQQY